MNTLDFTCTAWRRNSRNGPATLVLKCEMNEDAFTRGPFLRHKVEAMNRIRCFELCFHHGWPTAPPTTGRRVKFEHLVPDWPAHVTMLRIYLEHGEYLTIEGQRLRAPERPYRIGDGDPRDARDTGR